MQKTLSQVLRCVEELKASTPLTYLAEREAIAPRFLRNRLQMALLSPAIMKAILKGRQPGRLCAETFARTDIPLDWDEQARVFGFRTA